MGKEKYEIPERLPPFHNGPCPWDELTCLYEPEARKQARQTPDTHGYIHKPMPHKRCGFWHVYLKHQPGGTRPQQARARREDYELRKIIEGG